MVGMTPAAAAAPAPAAAAHSAAAAAGAPAPAMAMEGELTDPQSGCFDKTTTQDISDAPYYATLVNGKGFALVSKAEGNSSMSMSSMSSPFVGSPAIINVKKGKKVRIVFFGGAFLDARNQEEERHCAIFVLLNFFFHLFSSSTFKSFLVSFPPH